MKNTIIGIVVALVVGVVGGYFLFHSSPVKVTGSTNVSDIRASTMSIGSGCDSEFTTCSPTVSVDSTNFNTAIANALVFTGSLSTSTPASMTMKQSDLLTYESIVMALPVGSVTVTLPATSTLTSFIPTSGQSTFIQWLNASTTASQNITVSGGTGMNMAVSSSTNSTIIIKPKQSWLFRFIRQPNSDISVLATGASN